MIKIEVCGDSNYPPFEYIDHNGISRGFNVDITNSVAKVMGIQVSFNLMEWTKAIDYVKSNDFMAIQGMSISNKRRELFNFSKEYITVFHSIYTLKSRVDVNSVEDLHHSRIAVQENDISYDILTKKTFAKKPIHIIVVSNQEQALNLLFNKEVDAIAGNRLTIQYYAREKNQSSQIKPIGAPINITKFGVGFKKNRRDLVSIFNQGLQIIKENGIYQEIYDHWFGQQIDYLDKQIIENTGTGVICLDGLGTINAINNNACKMLKIEKDRNLFKSFYESELSSIFEGELIQKILDDSSSAFHKEVKYIADEDSDEKWININISPLVDFENSCIGVIINFRDITKEKKSEEMLITQDRMQSLGRLLLNVAHEIRNPLTSIKNFVNLMPDHIDDYEFRLSMLKHVPQQVNIMDNLLKDLLNYSSPRIPNKEKVNLKEFFKSFFEYHVFPKQINLDLSIEDVSICVDEKQLWQIISNVVNNAVDAVESDGNIKIYAFRNTDGIRISIEDDGIGIAKSDLSKIFDPFFTKKTSGNGLGLFITYRLVTDNNGQIEAVSNGKGTKINIQFQEIF